MASNITTPYLPRNGGKSTTLWHIFCKVIDNYGDIGVCWRLACDLASRGEPVRLWVDDPSALVWMAPGGHVGVDVLTWASAPTASSGASPLPSSLPSSLPPPSPLPSSPFLPSTLLLPGFTPSTSPSSAPLYAPISGSTLTPATGSVSSPSESTQATQNSKTSQNKSFIMDSIVIIESFGCEVSTEFIANLTNITRPNGHSNINWINLEYISAQSYVEKNHGLPSPVFSGPGAGLTKHFFYPGFTPRTGGLLREPDLLQRQAQFDRATWLQSQNIRWHGERLISLFCYEPAALGALLAQLAQSVDSENRPVPVKLLVTHGRARQAIEAWMTSRTGRSSLPLLRGQLSFVYLEPLTQLQYDELLWACDLNFVRGEDSLVRACLSGKPFVWHIYPQHDDAHHDKLDAFLRVLGADDSLTAFHHAWNGMGEAAHINRLPLIEIEKWGEIATRARTRWLAQADLTTQLLEFVAKKR